MNSPAELGRTAHFYTIAFTIRTGSSLLCDYLTAAGLGQPSEYFQFPFGVANARHYRQLNVQPGDFVSYLRQLFAHRAQNGFFGVKLTWEHQAVLVEEARKHWDGIRGLDDLFPGNRWVYLRRRDKIGQAISGWRAMKSGKWHSSDIIAAQDAKPEYGFHEILNVLFLLLNDEYHWDNYFGLNRIEPQIIFYEDFQNDPKGTVLKLVRFVQQAPGGISVPDEQELVQGSRCTVLRDQYSADLKARFLDDLEHMGDDPRRSPPGTRLRSWMALLETLRPRG